MKNTEEFLKKLYTLIKQYDVEIDVCGDDYRGYCLKLKIGKESVKLSPENLTTELRELIWNRDGNCSEITDSSENDERE